MVVSMESSKRPSSALIMASATPFCFGPGFQQAGRDSAEALLYESQIFIPLVDGLSCNLLLGQCGLDDIAPI